MSDHSREHISVHHQDLVHFDPDALGWTAAEEAPQNQEEPKASAQWYNAAESIMTKEIEAVYEHGMIRPLQPLDLPEGSRLDVIVVTHEQPLANGNAAELLAEIAALPIEGSTAAFAGREHDSLLYPQEESE